MATSIPRHAVAKMGQQMSGGAGQGRSRSPRVRLQIKHTPAQGVSALPTPRPTPATLSPQLPSPTRAAPQAPDAVPELTIPRVFDIFDAPVHLRRDARHFAAPHPHPPSPPHPRSPVASRTPSPTAPRRHPHSPQPVVFDGPSRPAWPIPPAVRDSREQRYAARTESHHTAAARPRSPHTRTRPQTESRAETKMFDGPARLRRPPGSKGDSNAKAALVGTLALGAAAAGAAAVISAQ